MDYRINSSYNYEDQYLNLESAILLKKFMLNYKPNRIFLKRLNPKERPQCLWD